MDLEDEVVEELKYRERQIENLKEAVNAKDQDLNDQAKEIERLKKLLSDK